MNILKITTIAAVALLATAATPVSTAERQMLAECGLGLDRANAVRKILPIRRTTPAIDDEPAIIDYEPRFLSALGGGVVEFSAEELAHGNLALLSELPGEFQAVEAKLLKARGVAACVRRTYDQGLRSCEFRVAALAVTIQLSQARDGAVQTDGSRGWSRIRLSCFY